MPKRNTFDLISRSSQRDGGSRRGSGDIPERRILGAPTGQGVELALRPVAPPLTRWSFEGTVFRFVVLAAAMSAAFLLGPAGAVADPPVVSQPPDISVEATGPSTSVPIAGNSLDRAQACQEFFRIVSDYTMTDDQSARAFGDLADRTNDAELASAIRRVATLFAQHSESVPSGVVSVLCKR